MDSSEASGIAVRHARGCVELARLLVDDVKREDLTLEEARLITRLAREAEGWLRGARELLDTEAHR